MYDDADEKDDQEQDYDPEPVYLETKPAKSSNRAAQAIDMPPYPGCAVGEYRQQPPVVCRALLFRL